MSSLEDWGMPFAVLGLMLATVLLASIHHRYQAHQAEVRIAVRRIEKVLIEIVDALGRLGTVPLSRELRVLLRADVLARYRRIARLYRRYPEIKTRIAEAETALHGEGAPLASGVGPIQDEQSFRRLSSALDVLAVVIHHRQTLQPIPFDVRAIFARELGERKAEVLARFHLVEAHRFEELGDMTQSRAHLTTLMQRLRRQGLSTPFVQALYQEAEQTLVEASLRALDSEASGSEDPGQGASSETAREAVG